MPFFNKGWFMEYTWSEADIICGRYICKPPLLKPHTKEDYEKIAMNLGKIGFIIGTSEGTQYSIIAMTDGCFYRQGTKIFLTQLLNVEGYIPCPHQWLLEALVVMRDWYVQS